METIRFELKEMMNTTLNNIYGYGSGVWDFSDRYLGEEANELMGLAVSLKRSGQYLKSILIYFELIRESFGAKRKIPYLYMKGLFKTLICANQFLIAYHLICTIYADMQRSPYVNPNEEKLFYAFFQNMHTLVIRVIDNEEVDIIEPYCQSFSGSITYQLPESAENILDDLFEIRMEMRRDYNI